MFGKSRDVDNPSMLEEEYCDLLTMNGASFVYMSFLFSLNDKHRDDFGSLYNGNRYSAIFIADGVSNPGLGGRGSLGARFVCTLAKEAVSTLDLFGLDFEDYFHKYLQSGLKRLKKFVEENGFKRTATTLSGVILDKEKGVIHVINIGDSNVVIFPFHMGPKNDFYILEDKVKPIYKQALFTALTDMITEKGIHGFFTSVKYKFFPHGFLVFLGTDGSRLDKYAEKLARFLEQKLLKPYESDLDKSLEDVKNEFFSKVKEFLSRKRDKRDDATIGVMLVFREFDGSKYVKYVMFTRKEEERRREINIPEKYMKLKSFMDKISIQTHGNTFSAWLILDLETPSFALQHPKDEIEVYKGLRIWMYDLRGDFYISRMDLELNINKEWLISRPGDLMIMISDGKRIIDKIPVVKREETENYFKISCTIRDITTPRMHVLVCVQIESERTILEKIMSQVQDTNNRIASLSERLSEILRCLEILYQEMISEREKKRSIEESLLSELKRIDESSTNILDNQQRVIEMMHRVIEKIDKPRREEDLLFFLKTRRGKKVEGEEEEDIYPLG